jgi:hypothetical protein
MFLGLPLTAALDPDEIPKFLEHLHRCRSGMETHISTELKLGQRKHAQIPVELVTTPANIDGQQLFPTAIIDQRRSERRLQPMLEARHLVEHLFEFVSYPLAVLNENLIVEATNSAFREKFRMRTGELQGRSIFELEPIQWHSSALVRALQRLVRRREPIQQLVVECSLSVTGHRLILHANATRFTPRPPRTR